MLTNSSYILTAFSITSGMLEAFAFQVSRPPNSLRAGTLLTSAQGMLLLWLKHNKARFSQTAINTYPLGIQAVAIVSQIFAGFFIDQTGHRMPMVLFAAAMQLITASLLLVRNMSDGGIFTAHYLSGTSFIVNPVMYGWASTICQKTGDDAARSVVLYTMNMGGQLLYTWWGIVLYPATDVPYWKKGAITMIFVVFAFCGMAFAVRWVSRMNGRVLWMTLTREQLDRKTNVLPAEVEEDSASDDATTAVAYPAKTG
jgi:ACS family pantothenate transporter-like MFS transporter